ncbi:M16 family metallopeptidase [Silvanigrella sp.]|jgi:predicted Zn-dependent peptidase|uniref:M16 family metallopeptidase n=1 Tax=Silvanigrella sp. TaxID=2024976 RepID=UPI0037C5C86D
MLPLNKKHFFNTIVTSKFFLLTSILFNNAYGQEALQSTRPIIFSKPTELNWRSITWPSINYSRIPVDGGAAIYTLPSESALKFKINIILPGGVYSLPKEDRPSYGAMVDLLAYGGIGNLNFDELQNYTTEYGINLKTSLLANGQIIISTDALTQDFSRVIDLLTDIILKPRFDKAALPLWKQQSNDAFKNLLDSNTSEKQFRFIDQQANSIIFGKDHYFATTIERSSPKSIDKINYEKIKELYKKTISRNGLNAFISGSYSQKDLDKLKNLISKIPYLEPSIRTWLPSRNIENSNLKSIRTEIITKPDMSQCNISLRYYFPKIGKLNSIETIQFDILEDIFSSSGGIVGNDRFSKALRADSGISYSPHAYFNETILYPNTDIGMFSMTFQSPNERIAEAIQLATKTWDEFLKNGITQEELDNSRTSLINRMLASELTVFNRSDELMSQILRGLLPSINPIEFNLAKLDKQRSLANINDTLKKLSKDSIYPVLVIMGNPNADQINQIKKISDIEIVNLTDLSTLTKQYLN